MRKNNIIVYDYETCALPTDWCEIHQLAAKVINPRTLKWIKGAEFYVEIRPNNIDQDDWASQSDRNKTIEWTAKLWGLTPEQVVQVWKDHTITEKQAWLQFVQFCQKYATPPNSNKKFDLPIACGYNITNFDNHISRRLAQTYKTPYPFSPLYQFDAMEHVWAFFEGANELKTASGWPSYSFDVLRPYLGLPTEGAHNALVDVEQEGMLAIRLLNLYRGLFPKINFKGAFA